MNDRLAVFFDSCVFEHDTGKGFFEAQASPYLPVIETHPENSERVRNMYGVLKEGPIAEVLDWYEGETATKWQQLQGNKIETSISNTGCKGG